MNDRLFDRLVRDVNVLAEHNVKVDSTWLREKLEKIRDTTDLESFTRKDITVSVTKGKDGIDKKDLKDLTKRTTGKRK